MQQAPQARRLGKVPGVCKGQWYNAVVIIAKQGQAHHQPDHAFSRKTASSQRHSSGLLQGFVDPGRIDQTGETLELVRRQLGRIVQVKLESHNKKRIHVARESVLAQAAGRSMP
jgi:hypothetical protein